MRFRKSKVRHILFSHRIFFTTNTCLFKQTNIRIDFEKRKFEFLFETPYANVKAHYIINGRILILPITGEGPLNVTFGK